MSECSDEAGRLDESADDAPVLDATGERDGR